MSRDDPYWMVLAAFGGIGIVIMLLGGASLHDVSASIGNLVLLLAAMAVGYLLLRNTPIGSWFGDASLRKLQKMRIDNLLEHARQFPHPRAQLIAATCQALKSEAETAPILRRDVFKRAFLAARKLRDANDGRHAFDVSYEIDAASVIFLILNPADAAGLKAQLFTVPPRLLLSYLDQYRAEITASDAAWLQPRP